MCTLYVNNGAYLYVLIFRANKDGREKKCSRICPSLYGAEYFLLSLLISFNYYMLVIVKDEALLVMVSEQSSSRFWLGC